MKFKKETLHIDSMEIYNHTRSPFANVKMTGCGAHKSKKDYDRKNIKKQDKKVFEEYR